MAIQWTTIGDCKLACADYMDVIPLIPAASIHCVIVDPPYGVRRPSARRRKEDRFDEIHGNDVVDVRWAGVGYLTEGGACYCFCTWDTLNEFRTGLKASGLHVRSCVVWDKGVHGLGDTATCWAPRHEMILFAAKGRHELRSPRPADVIQFQRVMPPALKHPYQKPVEMISRLIQASTDEGDTVADWYMGSGTCGVACVRTGRKFIGCEISQEHFDITCQSIETEYKRLSLFITPPKPKTQRQLPFS